MPARSRSPEDAATAKLAREVWVSIAHDILEAERKPMASSNLMWRFNSRLQDYVHSNFGERKYGMSPPGTNRVQEIYQPDRLGRAGHGVNFGVTGDRLQPLLERDPRFVMTGKTGKYGGKYERQVKHWALVTNVERWAAEDVIFLAKSEARQRERTERVAKARARYYVADQGLSIEVRQYANPDRTDHEAIASFRKTIPGAADFAQRVIRELVEAEVNG